MIENTLKVKTEPDPQAKAEVPTVTKKGFIKGNPKRTTTKKTRTRN